MAERSIALTDDLQRYIMAHSTQPDEVARDLRTETHAVLARQAGMQIGSDQAVFLTMLTRLVGARQAVEVGTFTGYSSLAISRGLAAGGKLLCCDVSEEYTAIARRYWERAGVADRIQLRIAPAIETLRALPAEPYLDLSFIDADKEGYVSYWDEIVPRTRQGGVIAVDNTLWSGRVVDEAEQDDTVRAIRAFNDHAAADDRVDLVVLPLGDGVTLARKR